MNFLIFLVKLANDSVEYGLGYNSRLNETFDVKLFAGAIYNSNRMNLYIQVYDNDGAFSIFNIPHCITVNSHETNLTSLMNDLITDNPLSDTNIILYEGSFKESGQEIQRISSLLNDQSFSDKLGLILKGDSPIFPQLYGPLSNYFGVIPVILVKNYYLTDEIN
jgi:hypothetical protein